MQFNFVQEEITFMQFCRSNCHLFSALTLLGDFQLEPIRVLDEQDEFIIHLLV